MNAKRWSKLEQVARDTRDKQRESLLQLQGKHTEQLSRIEQLAELHNDYRARLVQLGQTAHSPQQARQIREFLGRIHELQCKSQTYLETLNKAVNAAQATLISTEHDRIKFEVLNNKLQQRLQQYELEQEQKISEASSVSQYIRQKIANGTSLA